jgi:hypothetical protein
MCLPFWPADRFYISDSLSCSSWRHFEASINVKRWIKTTAISEGERDVKLHLNSMIHRLQTSTVRTIVMTCPLHRLCASLPIMQSDQNGYMLLHIYKSTCTHVRVQYKIYTLRIVGRNLQYESVGKWVLSAMPWRWRGGIALCCDYPYACEESIH